MSRLKKQTPVAGDGRRDHRADRRPGRHRLRGADDQRRRDQEADDRRRQAEEEDADRLPDQHQQARRGAGARSAPPTPTGRWSTTPPAPATRRSPAPATRITAAEGGGAVTVTFPHNVAGCANVAGRNNAGTTVPNSGYAQTNSSAANAERDRSPHPRQSRRQRGRRLPPDRRLPLKAAHGSG